MNIRMYAVITKMGKPSTWIWKNIQPGSEYMFSFLSFPNIYILWLCRPNILNFYALFWTTWLASTEKQSWVGLSHFWKTYTLYLFAICDTDLRSPCHIFGRLTRAEIRLRDQEERKYRCGRKIKTQSDIFCKHRQNRKGDCFLPKNQIKTSKIVKVPKACQCGEEVKMKMNICLMPWVCRRPCEGSQCMECGKRWWRYGSWIYTQSYTHWSNAKRR